METKSPKADVALLQERILLPCGRYVPNRLAKVALYESLADFGGGPPNAKHFKLYSKWATGDWGIIITGNTQVEKTQLTMGRDMVIPTEITPETIAPYIQLRQSFRPPNSTDPSKDPLALIQLSHSGRQAARVIGGPGLFGIPKALSATPIRPRKSADGWFSRALHRYMFPVPQVLTDDEIDGVIDAFVRGAKVAMEAGFDGVELHAAHGYLLASFLSPRTNLRTGRFGFPNELVAIKTIATRIRELAPSTFVLGIKLNAADYVEGGVSEEIALSHVKAIAEWRMFDFIEISGGDYETLDFMENANPRQAFFASFSRLALNAIPKEEGMPLIMLTGSLRIRSIMANTVRAGHSHLIGIGRPSVLYPHYPKDIFDPTPSSDSSPERPELPVPDAPVPGWIRMLNTSLLGAGMNTAWHCALMWRMAKGRWSGLAVPCEAREDSGQDKEIPPLNGATSLIELYR